MICFKLYILLWLVASEESILAEGGIASNVITQLVTSKCDRKHEIPTQHTLQSLHTEQNSRNSLWGRRLRAALRSLRVLGGILTFRGSRGLVWTESFKLTYYYIQTGEELPRVCSQSKIIMLRSYLDKGFPWSFAISFGETIATRFIFASANDIFIGCFLCDPVSDSPLVARSLVTVSMGQEEGGLGLEATSKLSRFCEWRVLFTAASTFTRSNPDSLSCSKAR